MLILYNLWSCINIINPGTGCISNEYHCINLQLGKWNYIKTGSSSALVLHHGGPVNIAQRASESHPELEAEPVLWPPLPTKMPREHYAQVCSRIASSWLLQPGCHSQPRATLQAALRKYLHGPHTWAYLPGSNRSSCVGYVFSKPWHLRKTLQTAMMHMYSKANPPKHFYATALKPVLLDYKPVIAGQLRVAAVIHPRGGMQLLKLCIPLNPHSPQITQSGQDYVALPSFFNQLSRIW